MGVAPYTFRNENSALPVEFKRGSNPAGYDDAIAEYRRFFTIGVDGAIHRQRRYRHHGRTLRIEQGRPQIWPA